MADDALTRDEYREVISELRRAVEAIESIRPDARRTATAQRFMAWIMAVTLVVVITAFGVVVWQRQTALRESTIAQCQAENRGNARWKIVWDALDAATPDGPQQDQVDKVQADQAAANAPLNCP